MLTHYSSVNTIHFEKCSKLRCKSKCRHDDEDKTATDVDGKGETFQRIEYKNFISKTGMPIIRTNPVSNGVASHTSKSESGTYFLNKILKDKKVFSPFCYFMSYDTDCSCSSDNNKENFVKNSNKVNDRPTNTTPNEIKKQTNTQPNNNKPRNRNDHVIEKTNTLKLKWNRKDKQETMDHNSNKVHRRQSVLNTLTSPSDDGQTNRPTVNMLGCQEMKTSTVTHTTITTEIVNTAEQDVKSYNNPHEISELNKKYKESSKVKHVEFSIDEDHLKQLKMTDGSLIDNKPDCLNKSIIKSAKEKETKFLNSGNDTHINNGNQTTNNKNSYKCDTKNTIGKQQTKQKMRSERKIIDWVTVANNNLININRNSNENNLVCNCRSLKHCIGSHSAIKDIHCNSNVITNYNSLINRISNKTNEEEPSNIINSDCGIYKKYFNNNCSCNKHQCSDKRKIRSLSNQQVLQFYMDCRKKVKKRIMNCQDGYKIHMHNQFLIGNHTRGRGICKKCEIKMATRLSKSEAYLSRFSNEDIKKILKNYKLVTGKNTFVDVGGTDVTQKEETGTCNTNTLDGYKYSHVNQLKYLNRVTSLRDINDDINSLKTKGMDCNFGRDISYVTCNPAFLKNLWAKESAGRRASIERRWRTNDVCAGKESTFLNSRKPIYGKTETYKRYRCDSMDSSSSKPCSTSSSTFDALGHKVCSAVCKDSAKCDRKYPGIETIKCDPGECEQCTCPPDNCRCKIERRKRRSKEPSPELDLPYDPDDDLVEPVTYTYKPNTRVCVCDKDGNCRCYTTGSDGSEKCEFSTREGITFSLNKKQGGYLACCRHMFCCCCDPTCSFKESLKRIFCISLPSSKSNTKCGIDKKSYSRTCTLFFRGKKC